MQSSYPFYLNAPFAMNNILLYYQRVSPTTWVYLSSLLVIALFFKFNRVWSVRNLDLIGLILFAPGLLLAIFGESASYQQVGYVWLFVVGGLFMIRMLLDPIMVRRPLLEPNLTVGGLTFLGLSLLIFQMANVVTENPAKPPQNEAQPAADAVESPPNAADQPAARNPEAQPPSQLDLYGPGYPWVLNLFQIPTRLLISGDTKSQPAPHESDENTQRILRLATARTVAIFSYLAIVIGLVFVGYRHFDNIRAGIAAAVLFLLLPYTAILTGRSEAIHVGQVYHVLLAALLVWAVAAYRRPLVSGVLLGLSIGMFYYPIFLLPLWCSFYWQRGLLRFAGGVVAMIALLVGILYFNPYPPSFVENLRQMFGWIVPRMDQRYFEGFWHLPYNAPVFRIPVLAAFVAMCITLAIWPAQKNLGTLMSCSAAVMLGTQFWHAMGGGQLMGWYLPLLLLTIFRPNLEDRVALSVLGQWSFARRKPRLAQIDQAA
jgi:hypothetical protein